MASKKKMTRFEALEKSLPKNWQVRTYSPGDGVTRYRFFKGAPKEQSYFGPKNGDATVLGIGAAETFADALGR